ncbi:MAG TPA: ketosteroid isomerase family protein, partial [Terriglobales bacterium]|nr:ketosteroid isomerase family protein [Terriglobales bacterium]
MYRSYSYGGGVNSAQPEDVATKIRELTKDFCTAFNTGNHDHAAALFQAEGLFMAPGTDPVQGRKAIEAKLREFA